MVVPEPDYPKGRPYGRGEGPVTPVIMRPGDVAFVSTVERLCMPWDLAANLGIKFSFARRGILVLTGLIVDPGFGLEQTRLGRWRPKEDERLHFVLVNLGQRDFVIQPGVDRVASLQFLEVAGPVQKRSIPSGVDMEREFFGSSPYAMTRFSLFHELRLIQTKTSTDLHDFRLELEAVQAAANTVVVFGVYLLAVTILVAGTAAILTFIGSDAATKALANVNRALPAHSRWPVAVTLAALFLGAAIVIRGVLDLVANVVGGWVRRSRASR
jgi:hypothetical protein